MAYNTSLFRKFRNGGMTAKGSFVLADEIDQILTDLASVDARVAAPVADVAGGASAATIAAKVNELLAALRTAGLLDT